jgi:hypothetical protein
MERLVSIGARVGVRRTRDFTRNGSEFLFGRRAGRDRQFQHVIAVGERRQGRSLIRDPYFTRNAVSFCSTFSPAATVSSTT